MLLLLYQRYPQVDAINWTKPVPEDEGVGQANPGTRADHQDTSERTGRSEGGTYFLSLVDHHGFLGDGGHIQKQS